MLKLSNYSAEKHHDRYIDGLFIEVVIDDNSIYVNSHNMRVIKIYILLRILKRPTTERTHQIT